MERAERLLDLVALFLNAREAVAWSEIQESFPDDYGRGSAEANIRKFERDKADLAELGLALTYVQGEERDKDGYLLDRGAYYLPDLTLATEELAVLYAAGAAALAEAAFPFREDLSHALKKMAFAAGDEPGVGRDWSRVVVPRAAGASHAFVDEISRAVAARKFVEFDYQAQASGEQTVLQQGRPPHGLVYRLQQNGLVMAEGYCHLRKDLRSFRVDRMEKLSLNAARPRSADFEMPADFKIATYAVAHPWEFRRHAPIDVKLRLSAELAWLAERTFAGAQVLESGRGGVTLGLKVRDQDALIRALLPLGPGVEIRAPEALRARMRHLLKELLAQHTAGERRRKAG